MVPPIDQGGHNPCARLQASESLIPALVRLSPSPWNKWTCLPGALFPDFPPFLILPTPTAPSYLAILNCSPGPPNHGLLTCPQIHFWDLHSSFPSSILQSPDHSASVCTSSHEENARGLLLAKGEIVDKAQTSMCGAELDLKREEFKGVSGHRHGLYLYLYPSMQMSGASL